MFYYLNYLYMEKFVLQATELSREDLQDFYNNENPETQAFIRSQAQINAGETNKSLDIIVRSGIVKDTNSQIVADIMSGKINPEGLKQLNTQSSVIESVKNFFDNSGLNYWQISTWEEWKGIFLCPFGWWGVVQNIFTIIDDNQKKIDIISKLPLNISAEKRWEVMEFITRANFWMSIWGFQMDLSDGNILFNTWFSIRNWQISDEALRTTIHVVKITVDRYYTWLMQVLSGWISPEDAVRNIES